MPGGDLPFEAVAQPLPGAPPVVQGLRPPRAEGGGGLPVELAAGRLRRVDHRDPYALTGRRQSRGEACGAGADDRQTGQSGFSAHGPSPPEC